MDSKFLKFNYKMVSKKRSRYEMIDKTAIIHKLDENLHTSGPNAGKPNFPSLRNYIHSLQENVKRFRQYKIMRRHLVKSKH